MAPPQTPPCSYSPVKCPAQQQSAPIDLILQHALWGVLFWSVHDVHYTEDIAPATLLSEAGSYQAPASLYILFVTPSLSGMESMILKKAPENQCQDAGSSPEAQ